MSQSAKLHLVPIVLSFDFPKDEELSGQLLQTFLIFHLPQPLFILFLNSHSLSSPLFLSLSPHHGFLASWVSLEAHPF